MESNKFVELINDEVYPGLVIDLIKLGLTNEQVEYVNNLMYEYGRARYNHGIGDERLSHY